MAARHFILMGLLWAGFTPVFAAGLCREALSILGTSDIYGQGALFTRAAEAVLEGGSPARLSTLKFGENNDDTGNVVFRNFVDQVPVVEKWGTKETPVPVEGASQWFSRSARITLTDGTKVIRAPWEDYQTEFKGKIAKVEFEDPWKADVLKAETPQGTQYFRPYGNGEGATRVRKALAASVLNQLLGIDVVPLTVMAKINEKLGALSHEAPGKNPTEDLEALANSGKAEPNSVSDAMAFGFLIGETDGLSHNIHIDDRGRVRLFDQDLAFTPGFVTRNDPDPLGYELAGEPVGVALPSFYTDKFQNRLRRLSPANIRRKLEYYLSEAEIEAVILRREILLKAIEQAKAGEAQAA